MTKLPYRYGAAAYIVDGQHNLLLVQLVEYADNEWNVPGGGREATESAEENIAREIHEELGIRAADLQLLDQSKQPIVYDFPQRMFDADHPMTKQFRGQHKDTFVFSCNDEVKKSIRIDPGEIKNHCWVPFSELDAYLIFPNQLQYTRNILSDFFPVS